MTTRTTRGRPREFDRDAALTRAMRVFWAKGYEGASISDLTSAMGIASPSLYAAFGSKEALFREALALYGEREGASLWTAVAAAPTARGAVEAYLLESARNFTRPGRPRGCLVVLSALHANENSETVRRELIRRRGEAAGNLLERLRQGVDSGEIGPDTDIDALAAYYAAVQQGMSIQARDGASRASLEAIAKAALAAFDVLTRPSGQIAGDIRR
jgi:AcrR family transcriptional regulator